MILPQSVIDLGKVAASRYPTNIKAATRMAEKAIRALPEFEEIRDNMFVGMVEQLVYDMRHRTNSVVKKESGCYGQPAKVEVSSKAVNEVAESVYSLRIAGTMLGLLLGEELLRIADSERAIAGGHTFNAMLCERLAVMVPAKKRVKDAVKASKLMKLAREVKESIETEYLTTNNETENAAAKCRTQSRTIGNLKPTKDVSARTKGREAECNR